MNRHMRVALVILHADPRRGGAERYTVDLAAALIARGHDVRVIATTFSDVVTPAHRVQLNASSWTRTGRYRKFLDELDGHLDQADGKYDIVHAMLPVRRCDVYHPHAGMAAEQTRRMNVIFNPRRVVMAAVETELLARPIPPIVLSLSEYVKRNIFKLYPGLPIDRLVTLFNAVDLKRFDPSRPFAREAGREDLFPVNPNRPFALMIAQDFLRKGLRETLEALASIEPAQRPALVVVGKGDTGPYERMMRMMRLSADVIFRGPTDAPDRYYRMADFFVLPTKHDPCSLVVLESLAMGVPVISTIFNGATEIMTEGVHGYVLPDPRDVRAIANAMTKMLDALRRERMSRACLELRPRLSFEHHLDRLEEIYRGVVKSRERVRL